MSKIRQCDLCDETYKLTYRPGGTNVAQSGRGAWRVAASFRRRLMAFLLGAPLVLKVWNRSRHTDAWEKYDICPTCASDIRAEIEERRGGQE